MGLIQANLPQHLVPLLVHECDACLSLTELMLLLLWMRMLFSFSLFVFRRLNPRDFASTVGHYCCHWCIASSVHLFCMLIIKVLHYCVVGENIPLSNLEIRSKAKVFFFFFFRWMCAATWSTLEAVHRHTSLSKLGCFCLFSENELWWTRWS